MAKKLTKEETVQAVADLNRNFARASCDAAYDCDKEIYDLKNDCKRNVRNSYSDMMEANRDRDPEAAALIKLRIDNLQAKCDRDVDGAIDRRDAKQAELLTEFKAAVDKIESEPNVLES